MSPMSPVKNTEEPAHLYAHLTPDRILGALEAQGFRCDGHLLALNSYENRVYQIGIEDARPVIAKFYRPARWSRETILEEHRFALELVEQEIPVVAPLFNDAGDSLHEHEGFLFTVYPRCGGRWPDLATSVERRQMGRFLGRIHAVGACGHFHLRPALDIESLGDASRNYLLEEKWIPEYLVEAYASLTEDLLRRIRTLFEAAAPGPGIRLHGDCHPGNVLWTDRGPHFVDLDDTHTAPPIQDLWMLLSGDTEEMRPQLTDLLEGYEAFHHFDYSSLILIEALRTLRLMHYSAWIAHRWSDPAFPIAFPWFDSPRYWEEHVLTLREQAAALDSPPLL